MITEDELKKNDTLNFAEFLQLDDCNIVVLFWNLIAKNIDKIL